ncbi:MAG: type IX secretion system protein PorQ [Bacteroidetes bacterium]|nr:type IX secretion system protein PorQ [Bacteroidota bacterium]MBS1739624.1 type IX secretion system protein PorQ [Bacteroidota bacterium]
MQVKKWIALCAISLYCQASQAQVIGGNSAMAFLRLPNSPHISALGGIMVANPEPDIAFTLQNPALMRPGLHNQLGLNYNGYYAGIKVMNLNYGYHFDKIKTSFLFGIQYLNYGSFEQTDAIGNQYGSFRASDYAITLGASRQYGERWRYGAALKWAHSTLYDKSAAAIVADVGVVYQDTANLLTIGVVAKNMGVMAKKYNPSNSAEPLPFDLQLGISKRFKHLPLRIMATAHHLYTWDIRYNNPADIESTNLFGTQDSNAASKSYFADKLFRHLNFSAELTLGKRLAIIAGYSHLRRGEMALKDKPALAGFSFGASIYLNKFQIHYARSYYSIAGAYNEIGLNFSMNKLFHLGDAREKVRWNAEYADWQQ